MRLSVLDQSPIPEGFTQGDALRNSIDLAQLAEQCGYHRYWLAEHHGTPGLACNSPEVLIGPVAAATSTIRVGSGGVMLPHYSPLKVAETFSMLSGMYGDRIDLAIDVPAVSEAELSTRGGGESSAVVRARVEAAITHPSDWPAKSGAAPEDVSPWWAHVVALHRKKRSLNKELKDAERALGEEPTDANLAWLRDVQGRLSALDGSEAQIDGFGSSSGRPARSL